MIQPISFLTSSSLSDAFVRVRGVPLADTEGSDVLAVGSVDAKLVEFRAALLQLRLSLVAGIVLTRPAAPSGRLVDVRA